MSDIVVLATGITGTSAAFELRHALGKVHRIVLVKPDALLRLAPWSPWVAVGWCGKTRVTSELGPKLARAGIDLVTGTATHLEPQRNEITLASGRTLRYDLLVFAAGPELAFDEIPGFGPEAGNTVSICTLEHAEAAWEKYRKFVADPGPIVVGAVQGASCCGPAYEFALILDKDLRRRGIRNAVSMTFVTSEPYLGYRNPGGVDDANDLMESEFRQRHIRWIANARVDSVDAAHVNVTVQDERTSSVKSKRLEQRFAMLMPAFRGVAAARDVEGLCNSRGFVRVDEHQRSRRYPDIYAVGVGVVEPPVEKPCVPTRVPQTGHMIEIMVADIVERLTGKTRAGKGRRRRPETTLVSAERARAASRSSRSRRLHPSI